MSTSDQDKSQDMDEMKKEEQEDASSYYAQGDSKDSHDEEAEFSKPISAVNKAREEMSLLKAVAYLGFGLAALSIIFILFFIRDLDDRVGGVDSAVSNLEEMIAPLKKEVQDSLRKVNADISGLKTKMDASERRLAVMELKRALIAVQAMGLGKDPELMAKTDQVVASIQSLLGEFGVGGVQPAPAPVAPPAGEIKVQEAPQIELPVVEEAAPPAEESAEETAPEPVASAEETPEIEELASEEDAGAEDDAATDEEEAAEEGGDEGEGEDDDKEDE
ncbi:MAG: hypothetical protein IID18_02995 [Nitrospinae bacterium]|nr:hypothetical protein [Nitrospinota bacterium]